MPDDTTPHGGEAMHPPPDRATIPQPKPGRESDEPPRGLPQAGTPAGATDVHDRPPLPRESEPMAADIEDEDADPVVDSGPGIANETGKASVTRQPG
jgi:hypothetical protein